jgi:hypothetical protein
MTLLICSLILFTIGVAGIGATARGTGLHDAMVAVSWLSIAGALLFLALFERARHVFHAVQAWWAIVPLFSFGLLAFAPFLWLALGRRRFLDWVVSAIYLAAEVTVIVALSSVPADVSITGAPAVIASVLLVVAPVHTVLAFGPAANVPTWRDVFPAWSAKWDAKWGAKWGAKREQPPINAVALEDSAPDTELR